MLPGLLFLALVSLPISCKDTGSRGTAVPDQSFYSAAEPGRWEAQVKDHDPECRLTTDDRGKKLLEVSVPFGRRGDRSHYVEVIVVQDGKGKEIGRKSFERGEAAETAFAIPAGVRYPITVVSKCNQHDMWKKEIKSGAVAVENDR